MTALRTFLAWVCYWAGDLTYRIHEQLLPEADSMAWGYQRLMRWSSKLQGKSTCGPWRDV